MNKKMTIVALSSAFIGMGIAMPQCPGEKAMQDQIDQLKATQITMTQKLQAMDSQVKAATTKMDTMSQAIVTLGSAVDAQKGALERLNAAVTEMQTKMAASATKG